MGNRGGQIGNSNATKNKLFLNSLKRQLIQSPERLEKIIEVLITQAESGQPWAIKELLDRIDGKPIQNNFIDIDENREIKNIDVVFVDSPIKFLKTN
jgi:hypothetical protein